MTTILGILLVMAAGIGTGTIMWPMKMMRRLQFEHYWFVAMLSGLVIVPWVYVLATVPDALAAYATVGWKSLLLANLFAFSWGIANVLYALGVERIGAALTGAIMTGFAVIAGTMLPLVMKGTGLFSNAPDLSSKSGQVIMVSVAIMLTGVLFSLLAGFGRERQLKKTVQPSTAKQGARNFLGGLIIVIIAGPLSAGTVMSFIYGQDIVTAMKAHGAGDTSANVAVWAAGLLGGAAVNIIYPAYLMTKHKSWGMLWTNGYEVFLSVILGVQFIIAVILLGRGMLMLGILGASIGFGIQQATQILGNQAVGFASGEWRGVIGKPRTQMYIALSILLAAIAVMAYSNSLAK